MSLLQFRIIHYQNWKEEYSTLGTNTAGYGTETE